MTNNIQQFFNDNEVLMVTGSMNANEKDRYMPREAIQPVHLIMDNQVIPVNFFDSWGEFGVSSFAWDKQDKDHMYFTTGQTPYKININKKSSESLNINALKDVHEIEIINGQLWLSNTGMDEAVAVDLQHHQVAKKIVLKNIQDNQLLHIDTELHRDEQADIVEKYHCNQITSSYEGDLLALVHHTSGIQVIRKVANKLIKNQGNGGVINLQNGDYIDLKLKSPHSIRKIDGNYWIFDSGNARAHIYDSKWNLLTKVATRGFGRGASRLEKGIVCAGISETRKRYLNVINSSQKVPNMVQFFSSDTFESLAEVVIPNIEQVNNVYTIDRKTARGLLNLH
jgi:hypothetical protein